MPIKNWTMIEHGGPALKQHRKRVHCRPVGVVICIKIVETPQQKVFYFFVSTTLQTHVRVEIDLVCTQCEIYGCTRNIGV